MTWLAGQLLKNFEFKSCWLIPAKHWDVRTGLTLGVSSNPKRGENEDIFVSHHRVIPVELPTPPVTFVAALIGNGNDVH